MYPNLNTGAIGVSATLAETADYAARHEFAGMDINIVEARNLILERGSNVLQEIVAARGLRLGGWGLPIDWRADRAIYDEELKALPEQAQTACELGCDRTFTWITPASDELDFDANYQFHVERLRPVAQILADHGIRFGLEFVGPATSRQSRKYSFIYTMDDMLGLAQELGTGNVGLLVDLWHVYTSHGDIQDLRKLNNHDVVYVHINDAPAGIPVDEQKDNIRTLPGATGVTDIVGFLQALDAIGYDGPVTIEPFNQRLKEMPREEAVSETAKAMHKVWQEARIA